jgi:alpha-mannosidase
MLDFHLDLAEATATKPSPYRNRFNCDGSYWLWSYEQRKSPAEMARLIRHLQQGNISVPLNWIVSCYGAQPLEAVLRGLYPCGRWERQHGLRFPLAVAMENQSLPLGLASLFAGCGARYSWRGVCGCASALPNQSLRHRPQEIYWWTGLDGRRLLLKWYSLAAAGNRSLGGYAEAFDPVQAVEFLAGDPEFLRRYRAVDAAEPFAVRGAFGFGWDALGRKTGEPYSSNPVDYPVVDHFSAIAERLSGEQRQVIVSNEVDFFEDFLQTHGSVLETQAVTYGNEWDLYSASMAETSARVKRSVERWRSAEFLATLASLQRPDFMQSHQTAKDRAYRACGSYWEHNWTADGPISRAQRAAWQEGLAHAIEDYAVSLQAAAMAELGHRWPAASQGERFCVVNPLSWPRTEAADLPYAGPSAIHVREVESGAVVPHQLLTIDRLPHLRILARDVPAAGLKLYDILAGDNPSQPSGAPRIEGSQEPDGGEGIFENAWIRIRVEPDGALSSFIDKRRGGRELAANLFELQLNDFAKNSRAGEPLIVRNSGPVSTEILASSRQGVPHTTCYTLYRHTDRLDIRNEILANFSDLQHWAFSFALTQPTVHTEEIGAILLNKLQRHGGHYADHHARYDYLSVNHFADISDQSNTRGVTISNPDLAFARLGLSTPDSLDESTPQLSFLAGGQVDGPQLGIPAQNGNSYFLQRFALRPHAGYDPGEAMRFALEHQNPLVTGRAFGTITSDGLGLAASWIQISHPEVLLWSVKPHEEGIAAGVVVRLWNVSNQPAEFALDFSAAKLRAAYRANHLETREDSLPLRDGQLGDTLAPQQVQTYLLLLADTPAR